MPKGIQANLTGGQFEDEFDVDIKKLKFFCNPVDKNGEGIQDNDTHLVVYQIKDKSKAHRKRNPLKDPNDAILTHNQFGRELLGTVKPEWLLVPAEKNPSGP